MSSWTLRVSVEPDELDGGFIAECPDVPGAMSQGETVPEALTNLIDAVQGVIAARMEEYFETLPTEQPESPRALSVAF